MDARMTALDRLVSGAGAALVGGAVGLALVVLAAMLVGRWPPAWQPVLIAAVLFGGRGLGRGPRASDLAGPFVRRFHALLAARESPARNAPVAPFQIGDFVVVFIALAFLALWFAVDA